MDPTPYPKGRLGRLQCAFLASYEETGNLTEAAESAGLTRGAHYYWLNHGENAREYAEAFALAEAKAIDALEREARRRGIEGWQEPVFFKGEIVGHVLKKSDRMLELLLSGKRPEVFSTTRHKHEHTGPGGGPMRISQGMPETDQEWIDRYQQLNLPIEQWMPRIRDIFLDQQAKTTTTTASATDGNDQPTITIIPKAKKAKKSRRKPPAHRSRKRA